jgi:hypothetical protein
MAKASKQPGTDVATTQKKPSNKKNIKVISDEIKRQMIAEAAFYNSQNREQLGGDSMQDWLLAEKQIEQQLN